MAHNKKKVKEGKEKMEDMKICDRCGSTKKTRTKENPLWLCEDGRKMCQWCWNEPLELLERIHSEIEYFDNDADGSILKNKEGK